MVEDDIIHNPRMILSFMNEKELTRVTRLYPELVELIDKIFRSSEIRYY